MSHYIEEELEIKDVKCILKSLEQLDSRWNMENIELHEGEGANLIDYRNKQRPQRCNLIVRKKHVNDLSNDFGFKQLDNGNWMLILDEYTRGNVLQTFKGDFISAYTVNKGQEQVDKLNGNGLAKWRLAKPIRKNGKTIVKLQKVGL